jgi:hypothetical protein
MLLGGGPAVASTLEMASALAGAGIVCVDTPQLAQRAKEMTYTIPCKGHGRHQGEKEKQRRLKRLAEAVRP